MTRVITLMMSLFLITALASTSPSQTFRITIPHCLVSPAEEALVAAEGSGVLVDLPVAEGYSTREGETVAQVDNQEAEAERCVLERQYGKAKCQAENDIDIRFSNATSLVATAELEEGLEANSKMAGTFAQAEIRRLRLSDHRGKLQIEMAERDFTVANLEAEVLAARLKGAQIQIQKHRISAPLNGIVVEKYRQRGEWVNAGDPIFRIVAMDKLRVEGFLKADEFLPHEVLGRRATIIAHLPGGRTSELHGRMCFTNPEVEASGEFRIWAEVDNERVSGNWLLRPGMAVTMTIAPL